MKKKQPSLKDVARLAEVSTATVSNVFTGRKPVNSDLQDRVRDAAAELGYQVDRVASQLRSGRAKCIAVIVPDIEDPLLARFISLLEIHAEDAGYDVIVSSSRDDKDRERSRLRAMLSWKPAGVIAVPCSDDLPEELVDPDPLQPIVCVERVQVNKYSFDVVSVDNAAAGRQIAMHLRESEVSNILVVAPTFEFFTMRERLWGIQDSFADGGMAITTLVTGKSPTQGAEILEPWLRQNEVPGAIVGLSHVATLSALSACTSSGISIPEDTLLVGFHDSPWMTARKVPITTVAWPIDEIARNAWRLMHSRISGELMPIGNLVLQPELRIRRSSQRNK